MRWRFVPLLLLVTACSFPAVRGVPPARPAAADSVRAWQSREAALRPLTHWEIRGRVAVRSGESGGQAALHWVRDGDSQAISLNGPLGRGLVRIRQDASGAELVDAERHVYRADSAEQLLFEITGWHIPLHGLDYWMRGVTVPDTPSERTLDEFGRLKTLGQLGWQIEFLEYQQVGAHELPRRFNLTLPEIPGSAPIEARGGEWLTEARLVIERWVLGH